MSQRDGICAYLEWGVDHEPDIHYTMDLDERMAAIDDPWVLPLDTDCSAFVTYACKTAGVDDPNGRGYNRTGNTATLLAHCQHIAVRDALRGDLIVYGPGGGDHVVGVIDPGDDPLCVSHGMERGPIRVRHSVEVRAHRSPAQALRVAVVDGPVALPPPPPIALPEDIDMIRLQRPNKVTDDQDNPIHNVGDHGYDANTVWVVNGENRYGAPTPEWLCDFADRFSAAIAKPVTGGPTMALDTIHDKNGRSVVVEVVNPFFLSPIPLA